MPTLIITDDERQPIVIGAVEILPSGLPTAREFARDAIRKFNESHRARERRAEAAGIVEKIKTRFGY